MASTFTKLLVHIVFSTKDRQPTIQAADESALYSYIGGICRGSNSPLLDIGGTADHVHLLVSLAKTLSVSDLLLNIKRDSSKWMGERGGRWLGWQDGYFAFSIGESGVESTRAYLARQKEHHATVDFKDEVRAFLRKHGIEWDEQYIWD